MDWTVYSRTTQDPAGRWSMQDIGLDRDEATAALVHRAFDINPSSAELLLVGILKDEINPETDQYLEGDALGVWLKIAPEAGA